MFIHKNENKSIMQKNALLSIIAILKSKAAQADCKRRSPTITINVYSQGYYNQISSLISKYIGALVWIYSALFKYYHSFYV